MTNPNTMNNIKSIMLKTALYIIGLVAIFILGGLLMFNMAGKKALKYVGEFEPDLTQIENGTYTGEYSSFVKKIGSKITFKVKDGRLMHYEFETLYGTIGYGGPERVISRIAQGNDLDFDTVSGATVTSNLAKAAIKNALENGPAE
jgi:uncharacterized protein with FMN-binding domain